MRRFFLASSFVLLIFFVHGLYLSLYSPQIFPENTLSTNHHLFYDYRGISHVMSKHTHGSLFPKDIILHAKRAKTDFLIFTDLNLLDKPYDIQGYHGNVFVFTSQKLSFLDSHILIYPENQNFYFNSLSTAHAKLTEHFSRNFSDEANYLAVLAHPLKRNHKWSGRMPSGLDGIEVLNLRQLWYEVWEENKPSFIWSVLTYGFNPKLALLRLLEDPSLEIKLWDEINKKSKTLGFLGNQTTSKIFNLLGINFPFPPYDESFSFASNHILLTSELTGHEETDRSKIYSALRSGHFYMALDTFGNTKGFAAYIVDGDTNYLMGDTLDFKENLKLAVDLPAEINTPFEIELRKNGNRAQVSKDSKALFEITDPGNYRVVVRIQLKLPAPDGARWFSWIYSNNFYIQPRN